VVVLMRNRAAEIAARPPAASAAAAVNASAATSAPPPVQVPTLSITSVPDGASISIDGAETGKVTPAAIQIPGTLPRRVQITLKGYQPTTALLTDADIRRGSIELKLLKEAGPVRVTITGSYAFDIVQGSRVISAGKNSHEIVVQPGQTGFRARNSEYFLSEAIDVDPRRPRTAIEVPELGTVFVFSSVERDCRITIDGQNMGDPPIRNQSVAAGTHTFGVKCEDGRSDTQRMPVPARDRTNVTLNPRD
jgi:PEGA domain-containing protein